MSPATWAAAIATTWRSRVVVATAAARRSNPVGSGAKGQRTTKVVTSSLVSGLVDDRGDGGGVADGELVDQVVGVGGHGCSIDAGADTALTRGTGRTLR